MNGEECREVGRVNVAKAPKRPSCLIPKLAFFLATVHGVQFSL